MNTKKLILVLSVIALVLTFGFRIFKNTGDKNNKYIVQKFNPGEYKINGKGYFENIDDLRLNICILLNLPSNCGTLTAGNNMYTLNIIEDAKDDSVAEYEHVYIFENNPDNKYYISKYLKRWSCHESRGSVSWTVEKCI